MLIRGASLAIDSNCFGWSCGVILNSNPSQPLKGDLRFPFLILSKKGINVEMVETSLNGDVRALIV